jgi:hypothetical protein
MIMSGYVSLVHIRSFFLDMSAYDMFVQVISG